MNKTALVSIARKSSPLLQLLDETSLKLRGVLNSVSFASCLCEGLFFWCHYWQIATSHLLIHLPLTGMQYLKCYAIKVNEFKGLDLRCTSWRAVVHPQKCLMMARRALLPDWPWGAQLLPFEELCGESPCKDTKWVEAERRFLPQDTSLYGLRLGSTRQILK